MDNQINESDFLFYRGEDGNVHAQVILGDETVWISQKTMSEIFGVSIPTINEHLQNIFKNHELNENSVIRKIRITATDGKEYLTRFYTLDVIIAVGYRVNTYKATKFRQWSTRILNEYLTKGFVLDDERLKQGNRIFGKDYFKELLERIREIRSSERMFYEKITDLYATSIDYDKNDPATKTFFAKVQNKLEYAVTGKTSAEIIKSRVDSTMPNMNLTTWKHAKNEGKILKSDVTIAKNYLKQDELKQLNLVVSAFLDNAEMIASRNKIMKMSDWAYRLDKFLDFNEYKILKDSGKIKKDVADAFAENEFAKFRVIQDKEYKSDFNKFIENVKTGDELPKEGDFFNLHKEALSGFNANLETALNFNPKNKKNKEKPATTKTCPNCGKVVDMNEDYCNGDVLDNDGNIVPCGHAFRFQF